MEIKIFGTPQKLSKKEVRYAAQWMGKQLLGPRLVNNVFVEIYHVTRRSLNGCLGASCVMDDKYSPRSFLLEIGIDLTRPEYIRTLAHEFVHIKQYARNELNPRITRGSMIRWNGDLIDEDEINYWDLPYEIEAFGREPGLYTRYKKHLKTTKLNFHT